MDLQQNQEISLKEFIDGLTILYKGNYQSLINFLFKLLDSSDSGYLQKQNMIFLFHYLPTRCIKCGKRLKFKRSLTQAMESVFRTTSIIRYNEFATVFRSFKVLGTVILHAIFSSIPAVIDSIFIKVDPTIIHSGNMVYNSRVFYFVFKHTSLYYYSNQIPVGIIYIKNLYLERVGPAKFIAHNTNHCY